MVNSVVLVGRLGRDPEVRVTSNGIPMCKFAIAVDRPYRTGSGEKITDWLDIVAWRSTAEFCGKYLQKGSLVAVQGQIQVRKWESSEGEPRRAWEIQADNVQLLSGGVRTGGAGGEGEQAPPEPSPPPARERGSSADTARSVAGADTGEDTFEPLYPDDDADPFGSE